ncbi:MAG: hypothetical protein HY023_00380 [Chloroflexi bacterium]|nr:hypothetical protein [Chloroflexota bacterium]
MAKVSIHRMEDPEKITIIEGPTPEFQPARESWLPALGEGPHLAPSAVCQLRTFNGPAMIERCRRAWSEGRPVFLDYRQSDGLRREAQVIAARASEVPEGHVLILWVRVGWDDLPEADEPPDLDD